jgi:type IV pilus assembly protein PilW
MSASLTAGRGFRPFKATRGFSLLELMIALTIGAIAIMVSLELFARAREVYRVNEQVARLQEQGRLAMAVIQPDVELAGFYGFTRSAQIIRLIRAGDRDNIVASAEELRQFPLLPGGVTPAAVSSLPGGAHSCGVNFAVDVSMPVQASNNGFVLGRVATACNPYQGRAQPGADTLTLRRVQTQASDADANRLQLYASLNTSQSAQWMFADGNAPGSLDQRHRVHNVVVRSYYVARDSVGRRDFPALRVKSLVRSGAGLAFDDEEVMSGVEDLQVQLGVAAEGAFDGRAVRYLDPDSLELPWLQVVAVRLWLRVRADARDVTFDDDRIYRYADVQFAPEGAERAFRRVLMSRTITLRNARTS